MIQSQRLWNRSTNSSIITNKKQKTNFCHEMKIFTCFPILHDFQVSNRFHFHSPGLLKFKIFQDATRSQKMLTLTKSAFTCMIYEADTTMNMTKSISAWYRLSSDGLISILSNESFPDIFIPICFHFQMTLFKLSYNLLSSSELFNNFPSTL